MGKYDKLPPGSRIEKLPTRIFEDTTANWQEDEEDQLFEPVEPKARRRKVLDPVVRAAMEKRLRKDELLSRAGNKSNARLDNKSRNMLMERLHDDRRMVNGESDVERNPMQEIPQFNKLHSAPGVPARPAMKLVRGPNGMLMAESDLRRIEQQQQEQPSFLDDVLNFLKD